MAKSAKSKASGKKSSSNPMKEGEYRSGPIEGTAIVSGATFSRKGLQYAEVDGYAIFEGDIILGRIEEVRDHIISDSEIAHAVVVTGPQVRWPNATIPYEIATNVTNQQRITDAIAHWEANTCIRFILRTPQNASQHPDFVLFQAGSGCSSHVGRQTGQQIITLATSCSTGNTIHEIGHTVGLWHEQSREDRDQFIRIVWANIDPAMQHNFSQHITDGEDIGNYDYGSIMHYSRTAFSNNGQDTIVPLQPLPPGVVMGQRNGLSQGDINAIRTIYCGGLPFVPPFVTPFIPPFVAPFQPPFVAPFIPPFVTPFIPPFVGPFRPPFLPPFLPPFQPPFQPPFVAPFRPPFLPPFLPPFQPPFVTPFRPPFQPPFVAPFQPPFVTPFRPPFVAPFLPPFVAPFRPPFLTPFLPPFAPPPFRPPFQWEQQQWEQQQWEAQRQWEAQKQWEAQQHWEAQQQWEAQQNWEAQQQWLAHQQWLAQQQGQGEA